jgi:hypothetical protein
MGAFMIQPAIKTFNTTGPCVPSKHYMLPVLPRQLDVDEMIEGEYYFILHAPRQSGKTTYLHFLTDKINSEGRMYALFCSVMTLRTITERDVAMNELAGQINRALKLSSLKALKDLAFPDDALPQSVASVKISNFLNYLSVNLDKDLLVFFDEADCLEPSPLITFLTQIRDGFNDRDRGSDSKFPRSMALVGLRDIRDYLTQIRPEEASKGLASPFNIKKEALTLANFTKEEIGALYRQHTEASGQIFEEPAIASAWHWSEGQPWLVNALAYESVVKILSKDYSASVTASIIDQAAENLIKRRDTHIDSLLERLKEPRVLKVMDSVFAGTFSQTPPSSDDRQYCLDLGLVTLDQDQNLRPANPIYAQVMSRVITDELQQGLKASLNKVVPNLKWTDGRTLFMSELLKEFQNYWLKNSDSFPKQLSNYAAYKLDEATYAFMLQSFLQKVVNSDADVFREYAEGRGAVDICILYNKREYIVEVKLKGEDSVEDSKKQLAGYLKKNREKEGWLVIFDRNRKKSLDKKITWETTQFEGFTIHIVGC